MEFTDQGLPWEVTWSDADGELVGTIFQIHDDINHTPSGNQWQRVVDFVLDEECEIGDQTTTFIRDSRGRVTDVVDPDGAVVAYEYDEFNRRTRVTDPEGNITQWNWNANGTLGSIENSFGEETTYTYDPNSGRIDTITNANGTTTEWDFGSWGQVESITHRDSSSAVLASFTYHFDVGGLPASVEMEDGRWVELEHDALGQLIRETWRAADDSELWSQIYDYDLAGNRVAVERIWGVRSSPDDTETTNFTFNDLDQLVSDGTATYSYDAVGNLTTATMSSELEWRYDYDPRTDALLRARLVPLSEPTTSHLSAEFAYGPMGRRMLRRGSNDVDTRYFYDGFNLLLERELHPTFLEIREDFHRDFVGYANQMPLEDLGGWEPPEPFVNGPDVPFYPNWDGYYTLDSTPTLAADNLTLVYGSGPSSSPSLPHSPPVFWSLIEPLKDPFVWAATDPRFNTLTERVVFGFRDADGDWYHDTGTDSMWSAGIEHIDDNDGVIQRWFIERWGPGDTDWTRLAQSDVLTEVESDPQPVTIGARVESAIPGLSGSRVTASELAYGNWQSRVTLDLTEVIEPGHIGLQAELPFSHKTGSSDPVERAAGGAGVWIWDFNAVGEMIRTDGPWVEERPLEDHEGATPMLHWELPIGGALSIIDETAGNHLSRYLQFEDEDGADDSLVSDHLIASPEDIGHVLTFHVRSQDHGAQPPQNDRLGVVVAVRVTDLTGDGNEDSRELTYWLESGTDSTNPPLHTVNEIHLDAGLKNSQWQTFSRDVRRDWRELTGGGSDVITINGLELRGGCDIDNLRVSTAQSRRSYTLAPASLGGTISVREVDPQTGANRTSWLHHDRAGSVIMQTDESGAPRDIFPATGRVVEACSGAQPDARWSIAFETSSGLVTDDDLAALLGEPDAQCMRVIADAKEGDATLLAGEQPAWRSNPYDVEWDEAKSHLLSLWIWRDAWTQIVVRGETDTGGAAEITLDLAGGPTSTYTFGQGGRGVTHGVSVPQQSWTPLVLDFAAIFEASQPVALEEIDGILITTSGELRLGEVALLGVTHASYSAWGETLADPRTGDVLSPLSTAAAWARQGAGTRLGWQSKEFDAAIGLFHNHARWYSPSAGRFTQASPMGWTFEHLYGYGFNSPYAAFDINGLSGFWDRVDYVSQRPFVWAAQGIGWAWDKTAGPLVNTVSDEILGHGGWDDAVMNQHISSNAANQYMGVDTGGAPSESLNDLSEVVGASLCTLTSSGSYVVYRVLNSTGRVVYIGSTINLKTRINAHRRTARMAHGTDTRFEIIVDGIPSGRQALEIEEAAIDHHGMRNLWNRNHPISPRTPNYDAHLERGREVLTRIEY